MRVIMVPTADRPECAAALGSAFQLAIRLRANVVGCHVRPHRYSKKYSSAAHALLDRIANDYGIKVVKKLNGNSEPSVMWYEKVGSPDKILRIVGPTSDMLVVSRPASDDAKVAQTFLMDALLQTSRPVMILPQQALATIGERVMVAWNQSSEAMRAVVAALPILQKADEVTIAVAGKENGVGPKSTQLAQYLQYWGIKSSIRRMGGRKPDKKLVDAYHETRSDLIVMGAFSRSRLRQRLFGGVTDYMLRRAEIPVLMLHS